MLKISLLRNVHKIDLKIGSKNSLKINFKTNRVLALSWRISLKIRFSRVFYTLNKLIYDIYYISFNIILLNSEYFI